MEKYSTEIVLQKFRGELTMLGGRGEGAAAGGGDDYGSSLGGFQSGGRAPGLGPARELLRRPGRRDPVLGAHGQAVTLKVGQLLLLVFAVVMIGMGTGAAAPRASTGMSTASCNLAAPLEIVGLVAFVLLSIWKSTDDWAARTGYTPPR